MCKLLINNFSGLIIYIDFMIEVKEIVTSQNELDHTLSRNEFLLMCHYVSENDV